MIRVNNLDDARKYLDEWRNNINEFIFQQNADQSIENYPDIVQAFNAMEKAWLDCFKDPSNINKITNRDEAIVALGEILKTNIL